MIDIRDTWRLLNQPCRDMTRLLSRSMDQRLLFRQRVAVKLHLLYCRACRRYRRHLLVLRAAMSRARDRPAASDDAAATGLSPEARERIRKALERE